MTTCQDCGCNHGRRSFRCAVCAEAVHRAQKRAGSERARMRGPQHTRVCLDCASEVRRVGRAGPVRARCDVCHQRRTRQVVETSRLRQRAKNLEEARRKERIRAAEWRAANPQKEAAKTRRYRDRHPEKVREVNAAWARANREARNRQYNRRRARLRDACSPGVTAAEWAAICEQFSDGETTWCAYCEKPAQEIEHIRPILRGGADSPENVVPACVSCNRSKGSKLLLWQWLGRGIVSADLEVA